MAQLSVQIPSIGTNPLRLLVVCDSPDWPMAVRELVTLHGIDTVKAQSLRQARDPALLSQVDAVLVCALPENEVMPKGIGEMQLLADALISHRLTGVVLEGVLRHGGLSSGETRQALLESPPWRSTQRPVSSEDDTFVSVSPEVSPDELWGRVATIRQYRPMLRRMEGEVAVMQRLGKKLNQQFVEVDQELRLASRLQRDFLPKSFPEVGDVRFAALYRPATWVSGDVYDIRRLDESHISFYLADAVGHGVAAGLLTMFIRQAVIGKRMTEEGYTLVQPNEVLAELNVQLAQQELPNCQFVTACYGMINTQTHELTFARGGHPHPILVTANCACDEVRSVGGLLGVFREETFDCVRVSLEPGEKLIVYSDGLEDTIVSRRERDRDEVQFTPEFEEMVQLPAEHCLSALAAYLDRSEGSLSPLDDQTCIIVERLAE